MNTFSPRWWVFTALVLLSGVGSLGRAAGTFVFIDLAAPGTGFSASEARAPVGGNPGTTLGEQRRRVFQRAGEIWGRFLYSPVPIEVAVNFETLGARVLAAAGPESVERDFPGAPESNTYYPVALANSRAGFDLIPGEPDIGVTVSSNSPFYLGLEGPVPGGTFSLLDVLLHELGHGLGFISLVGSSGQFFDNRPDVFSRRIFDRQLNRAWTELNAAQRVASRTNDPFLVWRGSSTTRAAPFVLSPAAGLGRPRVVVTPPAGEAFVLSMLPASFPSEFPVSPIQAPLVRARDGTEATGRAATACVDLANAAELVGKIVLIRRGGCFFDQKVLRAQSAGALAVIIANNAGDELITMGTSGEVPTGAITIPSVFVGRATGDALEALATGAAGANVRFERVPAGLGTDGEFVRLFAPASFSEGSSVSHWSVDASPNLLMEPFINSNLDRALDLTLTQMRDIGWRVVDIPFPHQDFADWAEETLPPSITARAPLDAANGSAITHLERYAFGLSATAGASDLPMLRVAAGAIKLRYLRSTRPADLELRYEVSTDLLTFRDAVAGTDYVEVSVSPLAGSVEEVVLRLLGPTGPRRFVRIRLTLLRRTPVGSKGRASPRRKPKRLLSRDSVMPVDKTRRTRTPVRMGAAGKLQAAAGARGGNRTHKTFVGRF